MINFDGNSLSTGTAAQSYRPPSPFKTTYPYVFLLYRQQSTIMNFTAGEYTGDDCSHCQFDVNAFVTRNNLTLIGVNWQNVVYDNSVAGRRVSQGKPVTCPGDLKTKCSAAERGTVVQYLRLQENKNTV